MNHAAERREGAGRMTATGLFAMLALAGGANGVAADVVLGDGIGVQFEERRDDPLGAAPAPGTEPALPSGEVFGFYDGGTNLRGGMFLGYRDLARTDLNMSGGATTYGLAAMYDGGGFALEGLIGAADPETDDTGMTFYQIGANIALSPSLELYGQFTDTTLETPGVGAEGVEATSLGIRYHHANGQVYARVGNTAHTETETTSFYLGMTFTLDASDGSRRKQRRFSSLAF